MPFNIEMTGAQDYQRMIKLANCGFAGTGKTLFASTAPQVFYLFFREQPRIMSIADRYMPHAKVTNRLDDAGRLDTPVWDTLFEVVEYLDSERGQEYKSVCVDTGDELFQALKEGRKAANRGKFGIQDWGWLGDTYREIINRLIDLPKNVIINYHLKNTQEGEDGEIVREIALQGQAKDEVAGWFDIVAVLDSWEEPVQEGKEGKILHRGMLTHTTPRYPFVKDHSGKLPKIFELSENFVGDFQRLHDLVYAQLPASDHEVIETITPEPKPDKTKKTSAETGVPTPDDIAKKKGTAEKEVGNEPVDGDASRTAEGKGDDPVEQGEKAGADGSDTSGADQADSQPVTTEGQAPEKASEDSHEAKSAVSGSGEADSTVKPDPEKEAGVTTEQATEALKKELGAVEVGAMDGVVTCQFEVNGDLGDLCGKPLVKRKMDEMGNPIGDENGEPILIPDADLMDLTKIRFRKYMCREHFTQARKG
jgi:hypothetical protein